MPTGIADPRGASVRHLFAPYFVLVATLCCINPTLDLNHFFAIAILVPSKHIV
jgi:hypothetical protein